jgi:hypothetical protein
VSGRHAGGRQGGARQDGGQQSDGRPGGSRQSSGRQSSGRQSNGGQASEWPRDPQAGRPRLLVRPLLAIAIVFVAVVAVTVLIVNAGHGSSGDPAASRQPAGTRPASSRPPASDPAATRSHPAGTPRPSVSTPAGQAADPLGTQAAEYLGTRQGTVMAAVYDLRTGQTWTLGSGAPQDEASIVKLDILETLLSQQPAGGGLTSSDQALAQQMIEDSDNDAATDLWDAAGGAAGIRTYNSAATGFPWPGWGLTTTVPADQLSLLREVVEPSRLLSAADRSYVLGLMENVTESQRWGVSGGVPATATVALKNGWLPLNDADTDWQVNSIGWVSGAGRDYLAAVVTTGDPTEQYGIDTVSGLSAMVWNQLG